MEREIKISFRGDANDLKRSVEEAKRALAELEKGTGQTGSKMVDAFQRATQEAKKMGTESASAATKTAQEVEKAVTAITRLSGEVSTASRKTASDLKGLERQAVSFGGAGSQLAGELSKMAGGLLSVAAAAEALKAGFDYNAEIQSLQLGISSIVAANETVKDAQGKQVEGAQKIAVAQGQVAQVFEKLKKDAIDTTATLPELVQAFQATLVPASRLGISLDDSRQLAVRFTQAMGAMNIPLEQARQEIGSILQLNITTDSVLARNLGLTNEQVKNWQEQGKLVDKLNERLRDFATAGQIAGEQWKGATSSLVDNLSSLAGTFTGQAFESITQALNGLNAQLKNDAPFGQKMQEDAAKWGVVLNDGVDAALIGAKLIGEALLTSADGWYKIMQHAKGFAVEIGTGQARTEMQRQAINGLGINPVQKGILSNFVGSGTMKPDALLGWASTVGVSESERAKLKTALDRIEQAIKGEVDRATDNIADGYLKRIQGIGANRKPFNGTITPTKASASAASGSKSSYSDLENWRDQYTTGQISYSDYLDQLATKLAKLKHGTEDYNKTLKDRMSLEREHAEMMSRAIQGSGYEVYGPPAPGSYSPISAGQIPTSRPTLKAIDSYSDASVFGGKSFNEAVDLADQRLRSAAEAARSLATSMQSLMGVIHSSIQGGDVQGSVTQFGQGLADQQFGQSVANQNWNGAMLSGGFSLAVDLVQAGERDRQSTASRLKAAGRGQMVDRGKLYQDYLHGNGGGTNILDPSNWWNIITKGGGITVGEDPKFAKLAGDKLAGYDAKTAERLSHSVMKGAEGDRARSLDQLDDWAASVEGSLKPEIIQAHVTAVQADIEATYKAAKAAESLADAAQKSAMFQGSMSVSGLRESLGLGKASSRDIDNALGLAGIGGDLTTGLRASGVLANADVQRKLLDEYQSVLTEKNAKMEISGEGAMRLAPLLQSLGLSTGNIGQMGTSALVDFFQGALLPALQGIKDTLGAPAVGSISGAGTDNALAFDAPMVRTVNNSFNITVSSEAFMGNKGEAREFARKIYTEIQTLVSQSV